MKLLNKKEQVFDFKLTAHGRTQLSKGKFSPEFYAFFDDNVIYDKKYVSESSTERQNDIHSRIKSQTPYLETQTRFNECMSGSIVVGGNLDSVYPQDENIFVSQGFIGDALLLAEEANYAPAWKAVSLANSLTGAVGAEDTLNKIKIPQINLTASYILSVVDPSTQTNESLGFWDDYLEIGAIATTPAFADGKSIKLEFSNPLFFIEELNTEFLTKNFDIEVYEVVKSTGAEDQFRQLFFKKPDIEIIDGLLVKKQMNLNYSETTSSVDYYFNVLKDKEIDVDLACKHIRQLNLESLLIDLDFDCSFDQEKVEFFDIYGQEVGDSEIC